MALAALVALSISLGAGRAMAHPTGAHLLDTHAGGAHVVGFLELPAFNLPLGDLLWAGLLIIGGIGLGRLVACRPRGRVIALGLSLALGVLTLETAVHSVHHLADPETAANCAVLSGSQDLSWGEAQAIAADAPPLCVAPAPLLQAEDAPQSLIYRPHRGRAPPA
jgi:hypothetical protein